MRMGGSLRRSRSGGGGSTPRRQETKARPARRRGSGRGRRLALIVAGVILAGWGSGYLVATRLVFPPAEAVDAEYAIVPDLRGLTLDDAGPILAQGGFRIETVDSIHHPEISEGMVVGQGPLPGQLAIPPAPIRVTLSLGPERREIPDVARLTGDRASALLRASGFVVRTDSIEFEAPVGSVVATFPPAGTERPIPSEVLVQISLGPPWVLMPDLSELDEAGARELLDTLGLILAEVGERRVVFNSGKVVDQSPEAGTEVRKGSEVSINIGRSFF